MSAKAPITLAVSNRSDFLVPVCALYLLVLTAALIGPMPGVSFAVAASVFAAAWLAPILDFSKSNNNVKLTSVIFPNGRVHLESREMRLIAGVLHGQQWCSRHLAVLRIKVGDKSRHLLILSSRQQDADEFRRLNVWLRQDLCNNAKVGRR